MVWKTEVSVRVVQLLGLLLSPFLKVIKNSKDPSWQPIEIPLKVIDFESRSLDSDKMIPSEEFQLGRQQCEYCD